MGARRVAAPTAVERELLDSELFYPVSQRPEADSQQLRGLGLVVARLLQRLHDRFTFQALELLAQRAGAGGGGSSGRWRSGRRSYTPMERQSGWSRILLQE